jgi:hypothetical protein
MLQAAVLVAVVGVFRCKSLEPLQATVATSLNLHSGGPLLPLQNVGPTFFLFSFVFFSFVLELLDALNNGKKIYITPSLIKGGLHKPQPMKRYISPLKLFKKVKLPRKVVLKNHI